VERRQAAVLYVLAAVVAFAAVLGAWFAASHLLPGGEEPPRTGHLTLLTLTSGDNRPAAAALVVRDDTGTRHSLYVIPGELLLSGPSGEYVFASDSIAGGTLREDLARVVHSEIDAAFVLPANALDDLVAADSLDVRLEQPITLERDGEDQPHDGEMTVKTSEIMELLMAVAPGGYDSTTFQEGVWAAVLEEASRRPADVRAQTAEAIALASTGAGDRQHLTDALEGLAGGDVPISRVPSMSRVAEGQFAFVPDPEGIMARITRMGGDFSPRYTVVVRNGSGKVGIGEAVVGRLAVLDVKLPPPSNADEFGHAKTQILAGPGALTVAEDIRAILGRGVVLNGADLSPDTVLVIVGDDLKAADLKPKDTP
jgi:hypothetical protein